MLKTSRNPRSDHDRRSNIAPKPIRPSEHASKGARGVKREVSEFHSALGDKERFHARLLTGNATAIHKGSLDGAVTNARCRHPSMPQIPISLSKTSQANFSKGRFQIRIPNERNWEKKVPFLSGAVGEQEKHFVGQGQSEFNQPVTTCDKCGAIH